MSGTERNLDYRHSSVVSVMSGEMSGPDSPNIYRCADELHRKAKPEDFRLEIINTKTAEL